MAGSPSGKTARLAEPLDEILPTSENVLVFVTRLAVLKLLQELLTSRFANIELFLFSGDLSLQDRAQVEQRFSENPQCKILLMTVLCGGIGLNLTAASHVIHLDRCYNPTNEAQATDRCHRLGQHRTVCVHRFVTEGTYEERLEEIMQRKQDLSSLTVTRAEDWIEENDDDALFDLFMLRSGSNTANRDSVVDHRSSIWASPLSKALSTPQRGRMSCAGVDVGATEGVTVGFVVVGAPVGPAAALALGLAFALAPTDTHHNRITSHHIPYIHYIVSIDRPMCLYIYI